MKTDSQLISSGVLILYNSPRKSGKLVESDSGVLQEVAGTSVAIARLGIPARSCGVSSLADLSRVLGSAREQVVFNLVEALEGPIGDMNAVPDTCRAFGKGVTGCGSGCFAITQDKWLCRAVLSASGLKVPEGTLVPVGLKPDTSSIPRGLCVVKPCATDASEGIDGRSVVKDRAGIARAVGRVHREFHMPALIEKYVGTREFNVSVIDRGHGPEVLPPAEIDFSAFGRRQARIVGYAAKWIPDSVEYRSTLRMIPAPVSRPQADTIRRVALSAWHACQCSDYARVDMRMNNDGSLYVLEVNANPDISQDSGFSAALAAGGIDFDQFVKAVLRNAVRRGGFKPAACLPFRAKGRTGSITIRRTAAADRDAIMESVEKSGFFRPEEIEIAREVLDEAIAKGPAGHYQSYTAEAGGKAVGWVSFGRTPCTVNTFDVYWIAVEPRLRGMGIGRILMDHAEKLIAADGGRLVVVETSGQALYEPTQEFYRKLGYAECARIPDFYAPGDAKVVFVKPVS